jgi:diguanylate cyclase (GGDEF)-like protein
MDPRTTLIIATLMMLLNGGVLGLMHRDLSRDVQPSAFSWRVSTLLLAGGCILLAVQDRLPAGFILPVANGCLFLGITGYWRAVRQFYSLPDSAWLLLPAVFGTLSVYWFAAISPNLGMRIVLASVAWTVMTLAAAWTLRKAPANDAAVSRRVLSGIFFVMGAFMAARAAYFAWHPDAAVTLLDANLLWNILTPLIVAVLPVIGTTAFLLLCSERLRRQSEHAAATDYLTGLPNRRTLTHAGKDRFARAQAQQGMLAVALADIDHFKRINDQLGHDTGDRALVHAAQVLRAACRPGDVLGRQGGEEFVAVFDGASREQALAAADRLRVAVAAAPLATDSGPVALTVSVGVSLLQAGDTQFDDMLRRADQALYAAKNGGRNRVELDVGADIAG